MGAGSEDLLLMNKKNLSFGLLSEIKIDDPETFEDKIFLTLDVDWAHDEVFADSIDFLRELRAKLLGSSRTRQLFWMILEMILISNLAFIRTSTLCLMDHQMEPEMQQKLSMMS